MAEPVYEAGAWIYKMIITVVVAAISLGVFAYFIVNDTNTNDVQVQLMLNRLLYSPDGLWIHDDKQTYPGLIDKNDLTGGKLQQRLNTGFNYPDGYGGMKISIISVESNRGSTAYPTLMIAQSTYNDLITPILSGVKRTGIYERHNYPVVIVDGNTRTNAIMQVEIVVPEIA